MSVPLPPQSEFNWLADRILELLGKVNTLMTQSDALNAGMAQLSSDLESVALAIQAEIQQLADAVAAGADGEALKTAADNAIAGLSAAHGQLTALQGSLAADDAAPTP